jgi:hypothetical protein
MFGWRTDQHYFSSRRSRPENIHNLTIMRSCYMQITHKRLWHCLLIIFRREEISWKTEVTLSAACGCFQMLHNSAFKRTNRGSVWRRKLKCIHELMQPELATRYRTCRLFNDAVRPFAAAARSEAWTVFARSSTGILGSNPISLEAWMSVCVYYVFVLFCV